MGLIKKFSLALCVILAFYSHVQAASSAGKIVAKLGYAANGSSGCKLFFEFRNETDQVITDLYSYGNLELFDSDEIFLSHGSGFDAAGEVFLGSKKVVKRGTVWIEDYMVRSSVSGDIKCSQISTAEFALKKASCKDRRGKQFDCDALLDKTKKVHKMSDLKKFDW